MIYYLLNSSLLVDFTISTEVRPDSLVSLLDIQHPKMTSVFFECALLGSIKFIIIKEHCNALKTLPIRHDNSNISIR